MIKPFLTETKIYVGLNDSESRKQKYDTEIYVDLLKKVCISYKVPFSFNVEQGGYIHEDGGYTEESTIVISMVDVKKELVNEIARDLCVLFNQESVMITDDRVRAYFVSESTDC